MNITLIGRYRCHWWGAVLFLWWIQCFVNMPLSSTVLAEDEIEEKLSLLKKPSDNNVRKYRHSTLTHPPRNIYMDFGANDGASVRGFLGHNANGFEETDGSGAVDGGWKALLSDCSGKLIPSTDWHLIALEASPVFNDQLETVRQNFTDGKYVASIKIYNGTAIANRTDIIDYAWDGDELGAGGTTNKDSFSAIGKVVSVPCIGIVQLFRKERITIEDHVVVKLDIEGAEYDIVRKIITSGLYRYIDKLAVEW